MARRERFLSLAALEETDRSQDAALQAPAQVTIAKPDELTWWDWAVFLLHAAAEIEHALLAQYLYAAYSLDTAGGSGDQIPDGAVRTIAGWRTSIITIAKEEMAHLLTEQNLLRFIGGPLAFERGEFPVHSQLYPFPLSLRPLTKTSLATYVAAEMPASPAVPDIGDIVARATSAEGGVPVNRVGVLFDTLIGIFSDDTRLTDADLRPHSAGDQAGTADWPPAGHLIVRIIASRKDALDALHAIADQGEGSASPQPGAPPSHFDRFLSIYRAFPDTESAAVPPWQPTRSVPVNPSTAAMADPDAATERNRITHPVTLRWAQLFNVRYRMLLTDLAHSLHLPAADASGNPTPHGQLAADAFLQMRGQGFSGLSRIAGKLTTQPAKQAPGPRDPENAGPPFELPYTLTLADDEHGRWQMHLSLLDTSHDLVGFLRQNSGPDPLLDELDAIDTARRAVVEAQLAAAPDS
jgi:ferritin-like protein